jgi:hypothetical protein
MDRHEKLLASRRGRKIAEVALARGLAVQSVLDVAQGMGLRASKKVRFARGTAGHRDGVQ